MTELGEYRAHRLLQLYVPPLIIVLGTFGNVFAFVILRNKAMLKFSTYFFLMVMSIADTLVLYAGLLPIWIGQLTSVLFRNLSNWSCKMSNVVGYTVGCLMSVGDGGGSGDRCLQISGKYFSGKCREKLGYFLANIT